MPVVEIVAVVAAALALALSTPATVTSSMEIKISIQRSKPTAVIEEWERKMMPVMQSVHLTSEYIMGVTFLQFVDLWFKFLVAKDKLQSRMEKETWRWYNGSEWAKDFETKAFKVLERGVTISQVAMLRASTCRMIHSSVLKEGQKCSTCACNDVKFSLQDSQYFDKKFWDDVMIKIMEAERSSSVDSTSLKSLALASENTENSPSDARNELSEDSIAPLSQGIFQVAVPAISDQALVTDKEVDIGQATLIEDDQTSLQHPTASLLESDKGKGRLHTIKADSLENHSVKSLLSLLGTDNRAGPSLASTSFSEPDFGETADDLSLKTAKMISLMDHMMRDNPQRLPDMLNSLIELDTFARG